MKKSILNLGRVLTKSTQKNILGGMSCIQCYNQCVIDSKDRIELGDCFDTCQRIYC